MKYNNRVIILSLFLFAISFYGYSTKSPATISISLSGAFALYLLAQVWAQEYNKTQICMAPLKHSNV